MSSVKDDRGYNQGFSDSLATRVRTERRAKYVISKMVLKPGQNALEIGCGLGDLAHHVARRTGVSVLGTDLCAPFIASAEQNYQLPNLRYRVADLNRPEALAGEKFDYVFGNGILHHLYYHLDEDLPRLREVLKDGGRFIFMEPNLFNPYVYLIFSYPRLRKLARLEPDEMAFTPKFITEKLTRVGFHDVQVEFRDFLLPGIPDWLIGPSVALGTALERVPWLQKLSQSIYITATK
jgi:2-polyprenyl-3-methyl-5-hydroxy-6-metoxy-1,4-benzoquinol methylase